MTATSALTGRLVDGRPVRISIAGGVITAVEPAPAQPACEWWIIPGLVDIQVNGYGGFDVNADQLSADIVYGLVLQLWRCGVTSFCPTLVTAPEDKLLDAFGVIARATDDDALLRHSVLGIHVEGPYLCADDGPRGAHDPEHIRAPDVDELARWREASNGTIRVITLAPELPGAGDYIRAATAADIVVAIGHTAAEPEQIRAAADAGARLCTHLGNGTHPILPRHPNYLWAQLAETRLAASFIADGHHLPADTFAAMLRAKGPTRSVLVSDTVALAGCPPGDYRTPVGGSVTVRPDGRITLAGSELLAGAARPLSRCLAWVVDSTACGLPAAARLATENPARLLGIADRGRIRIGASADLALVNSDLEVQATLVRGRIVYARNDASGVLT